LRRLKGEGGSMEKNIQWETILDDVLKRVTVESKAIIFIVLILSELIVNRWIQLRFKMQQTVPKPIFQEE
jgi:hypothetical protein